MDRNLENFPGQLIGVFINKRKFILKCIISKNTGVS